MRPQVIPSYDLNMYRKFTLYLTVTNHTSSNLYHVKTCKKLSYLCDLVTHV